MHLIPEYLIFLSFFFFSLLFLFLQSLPLLNPLLCFQLQMGTLQSRLDAEFLLAHMCSVKFKEWIVVLATLLRRSEVHLLPFYKLWSPKFTL